MAPFDFQWIGNIHGENFSDTQENDYFLTGKLPRAPL